MRLMWKPSPCIEGRACRPRDRLEFFYDAQTSGLLISVSAEKAEAPVEDLRKRGAASACIVIGEVIAKQDAALILKP